MDDTVPATHLALSRSSYGSLGPAIYLSTSLVACMFSEMVKTVVFGSLCCVLHYSAAG